MSSTRITDDELHRTALRARIALRDEDIPRYRRDLEDIARVLDALQAVGLDESEPAALAGSAACRFREDAAKKTVAAVSLFPSRSGEHLVIPPVMRFDIDD